MPDNEVTQADPSTASQESTHNGDSAGAISAPAVHQSPLADIGDKPTLWRKVDDAIKNLADVTVATLITEVTVELDDQGFLKKATVGRTQIPALITNVELISGDVSNIIAPSLKDDTQLTTFHQGIVTQAAKVLPDNLKALAQLATSFFGRQK